MKIQIICLLLLLIYINYNSYQEYFIIYKNYNYSDKLSIENIKNIKKGQKKMTKMLKVFDRICRKHKIKYWCDGGTLLGVVRHKGWIPYDGDIDICMMSDDYNKLTQIIQNELPSSMWFQNKDTDIYYKSDISKIRYINSCYKSYTEKKWHNGLQLDIFIIKEHGNQLKGHDNSMRWNKNTIFPLKEAIFDNTHVFIPNNSDLVLKQYYGDYLKELSVEKRYPHEGIIIDPDKPCKFMIKKYPNLYK